MRTPSTIIARYPGAYASWKAMKSRCSVGGHPDYRGRGIVVCDRWRLSFEAFARDMGERPDGRSIERRDVRGNYEPGNCVWATAKDQARNKRMTERLPDGTTLIADNEAHGYDHGLVRKKLRRGFRLDEARAIAAAKKSRCIMDRRLRPSVVKFDLPKRRVSGLTYVGADYLIGQDGTLIEPRYWAVARHFTIG